MGNSDIKLKSLRASEETFTKLKEIVTTGGFPSQGEALSQIVSFWELNHATEELPDQKDSIDRFNALINQIQDSYMEVLDSIQHTRDKLELEYNGRLKSAQSSIEGLRGLNVTLMHQKKEAEDINDEIKQRYNQLERDYHKLTKESSDKSKTIDILKERLEECEKFPSNKVQQLISDRDKAVNDLESYKKSHELEVKEAILQEREKGQKQLAELQKKYIELVNKMMEE